MHAISITLGFTKMNVGDLSHHVLMRHERKAIFDLITIIMETSYKGNLSAVEHVTTTIKGIVYIVFRL